MKCKTVAILNFDETATILNYGKTGAILFSAWRQKLLIRIRGSPFCNILDSYVTSFEQLQSNI